MSEQSLKEKVVHGVLWRLVSRLSTQAVTFVVGVVLARILGPEAYGTVAMLTIFVTISETLVNCGFGAAIIQKKNFSDLDWNSVFWLQISLAWFFYALLYFLAPSIASFYHNEALAAVLRVQALILPVHAVHGLQMSVIIRDLKFNVSFIVAIVGSATSAIIGLSLAFMGFGYWALVFSTLFGGIATMCVSCIFVRKRPAFEFSFASLREMFSFGGKMFASDVFGTVMNDVTSMVIARVYSPKDLACYTRGNQLPQTIMDLVNSSLTNVSFPAFSKLQDDPVRLTSAMRKVLMCSTFFVMPMMAGLSAVTDSVITLMLGEKWMESIPYATIACVSYSLTPFATVNLQAIKGLGLSGSYLCVTIIKGLMMLTILAMFCRAGVLALAVGFVAISSPLSMVINNWPIRKSIGYSAWDQIRDVLPIAMLSLIMGALVWSIRFVWQGPQAILLVVQMFLGVGVYYVLLLMFKPRALSMVIDGLPWVKKFFPRRMLLRD